MDSFAKLTPAEREPYFQETAARRNLTPTAIEKDFWVCWTLGHLFALEAIPELRFKGGTSLSKVFGLIERFSEDIDISVNRAALGFVGDEDVANAPSKNQRKVRGEKLRSSIIDVVNTVLLPKLQDRFQSVIGKNDWTLLPSEIVEEEMTLSFAYPRALNYPGYLRPEIKIDFGPGDQEPSEKAFVTPFVAEEFPAAFNEKSASVVVLDCQRTFWEKVTLLHAENNREDLTKSKPRIGRHWFDVALMSSHDRFEDQKLSIQLLMETIEYKNIYYGSGWADYESAVPGTLNIIPREALQTILRKDYKEMELDMFYGDRLSFDEILARLATLQDRINAL